MRGFYILKGELGHILLSIRIVDLLILIFIACRVEMVGLRDEMGIDHFSVCMLSTKHGNVLAAC